MKYYILVVLAVLFWSGNFIFGRYISSDIHPLELSLYRWLFVLLLLSPYIILRYKNLWTQFKNHYIVLTLQSILGISGFNTFLYYGLQTTTATNALLINSSIPIIIIVFSAIILRKHVTKIQLTGIVLSTLGVIYLVLKGNISNISQFEFTKGDFWIILACFDWALYTVLLKYKPKDLNAFEFFGLTTFIGSIVLLSVFIISPQHFTLDFIEKKEVFLSLAYIVIFPSILSFYFWNISTEKLSANTTGQFAHLMPIFGAVLAYYILGEVLHPYHFVGIVLIGLGIYLSTFFKKKNR
ncbi:DMT family transporter [Halarcobacter anaerophilus]|uniref:EamA family transporter n=1 Tax=Halarcobacter anaerophilus TaxID=877500 RepID=A0A4Q0XXT2_9BACT|nr:DMT family transporter [Halarcobacter anaerophilus]QDF28748.1 EamA/RhaT family transporter [Halarcobacter anaerophilus]RXJ61885.1 EamA family transporter [Halarcobacter anaerophilus]